MSCQDPDRCPGLGMGAARSHVQNVPHFLAYIQPQDSRSPSARVPYSHLLVETATPDAAQKKKTNKPRIAPQFRFTTSGSNKKKGHSFGKERPEPEIVATSTRRNSAEGGDRFGGTRAATEGTPTKPKSDLRKFSIRVTCQAVFGTRLATRSDTPTPAA